MNAATHERALNAIHDDPSATSWPSEVHAHVHACETCRRTWQALSVMVGRLRARAAVQAPAPLVDALRASIHAEIDTAQDRGTARRRSAAPARARDRVVPWAALAAGLALGVFLSPYLLQRGQPDTPTVTASGEVVRTVGDYLADVTHDRYLLERMGQPLELATADPAMAADWLSNGLGLDVALGTAPDGFTLEGARIWHTVSRLSALASYQAESGTVTVFAVPADGIDFATRTPLRVGDRELWYDEGWGFRGVAWLENGLAWSAVGTLERDALVRWVRDYRGF